MSLLVRHVLSVLIPDLRVEQSITCAIRPPPIPTHPNPLLPTHLPCFLTPTQQCSLMNSSICPVLQIIFKSQNSPQVPQPTCFQVSIFQLSVAYLGFWCELIGHLSLSPQQTARVTTFLRQIARIEQCRV